MGQVVQATTRLATGSMALVRSRVESFVSRLVLGSLSLLQNEYWGLFRGVKAAERRSSHLLLPSTVAVYMHPHPPWAFMACNGDTFIFKIIHEINFKIRSIRKQSTLNAIYPPWAEPEARNSAVGWHWNTHTFFFETKETSRILMLATVHCVAHIYANSCKMASQMFQ